jgi:hypothetical protein
MYIAVSLQPPGSLASTRAANENRLVARVLHPPYSVRSAPAPRQLAGYPLQKKVTKQARWFA